MLGPGGSARTAGKQAWSRRYFAIYRVLHTKKKPLGAPTLIPIAVRASSSPSPALPDRRNPALNDASAAWSHDKGGCGPRKKFWMLQQGGLAS
jgi:hypothetical protein